MAETSEVAGVPAVHQLAGCGVPAVCPRCYRYYRFTYHDVPKCYSNKTSQVALCGRCRDHDSAYKEWDDV